MSTMYNVVIYHKNCLDGFSGLCIFIQSKQWDEDLIIYPDTPVSDIINVNVDDKNVVIIDVAYDSKVIKYIANHAKKLLFLDHHITIKSDIDNLHLQDPHEVIYDVNMCGASLTWKYFMGGKTPKFIKYIQDNDTGTWKYKHTLPFIAAMEIHYETKPTMSNINKWQKLLNDEEINTMLQKGKYYDIYKKHMISIHTKRATVVHFPSKKLYGMFPNAFHKPAQYRVAIYNGTGCPSTSLLGNSIANLIDCDFCLIWTLHMSTREYVVSLRSITTDIGTIAKELGGGGHKFAAAFGISCDKIHIEDMFII